MNAEFATMSRFRAVAEAKTAPKGRESSMFRENLSTNAVTHLLHPTYST